MSGSRITPPVSLCVRLLLLCVCLLGAGAHTGLRAQSAPPPERLRLMSADTARGIELYKQGDNDQAIKLLKKASQQTPKDADAWQFLGLAYKQGGERKNAQKALERAVYLRFALLGPGTFIDASKQFAELSKEELEGFHMQQARRYQDALEAVEAYLQLTPKDAEFWRWQAENLRFYSTHIDPRDGPHDIYAPREVTTRAVILSKPLPSYTEEARRRGTSGRITLRLVLAADGTVQHILVLKPLPDGLTEQSVAAARHIIFKPAMKDGRPVSQFVTIEYGFNIY